jgi:hypothetical protein
VTKTPAGDALSDLAPLLRARPELQEFCRFGGDWVSPHDAGDPGWAHFHIVTRGQCLLDRPGHGTIRLEAGDILLLPHGDAHVVRARAALMFSCRLRNGSIRRPFRASISLGSYWLTKLKSRKPTAAMTAYAEWIAAQAPGVRNEPFG